LQVEKQMDKNCMKNCFLLFALFALNAVAQPSEVNLKWGKPTAEELNMTEYATDKEADAVELCRLVDVNYNWVVNDFRVFYRVKCRLKVLKPEGKRVGDQVIPIRVSDGSGKHETVGGLKATTYNLEAGKLVKTKMESSMVHEEQLDKTTKLIKFSVPQVRVGSVIEYEYRLESDFYYDLHDWYAQKSIPVVYTKYELSVPEWFTFNLDQTGIASLEHKSGSRSVTFSGTQLDCEEDIFIGRNLPALKDDDFVWCAEDYGAKVTHELKGIYVPGAVYKDYTSKWEDIDKLLLEDEEFGGRIKKSSPLKNEILSAGIPSIGDLRERAAACWQLLKGKVKWNGDYAFWAKSGAKVLKEGTGTNADINFLYINMLHDAGVEANPVALRLRNRGRLPLSHASLKYLSTFVVGIEVSDSTSVYMDASVEDGFLNVLPPRLLTEMARVIRKDRQGQWVNLLKTAHSVENTVVQATLSEDGVISGNRVVSCVGESAANLRRKWRTAKDSVDVIHDMQERDEMEIAQYELQGRYDFSPTVRETVNFTKTCTKAGDLIYLNPLVFIPQQKNPFTTDTRNLPVEFPYSQRETYNVMLKLPEGWQVEEAPQPILLKFDGITARIGVRQNGDMLQTQYKLDVNRTFFSQQQYQDLKGFLDKLVESNKQILTLKKHNQGGGSSD
jgi:hypothetical protein